MYIATINRKYYRNKAKRLEEARKLEEARQAYKDGKSICEISDLTGLSEYMLVQALKPD